MKALHPGMRVYVGWTGKCLKKDRSEMCQTGTLISGPRRPVRVLPSINWHVKMDSGFDAAVAEKIIFPIDDDEKSVDRVKELEEME